MIYLDNAATTQPELDCLEEAKQFLYENYYNPSALYAEGYNLHAQLKTIRKNILNLIADDVNHELIFTSGGTEADNHALFSCAKRGNIVISAGEHSAIYETAMELKQRGIEVRIAPLDNFGAVKTDELLSLVDEKTSLVSVMHVNNETGAVNLIEDISSKVKKKNKYTIFHSDGVQAFGKLPYFKITNDIDLYSISAHKIGGVKGVGALIKKKKLALKPFIYGGGQENGLRSGTENLFAIKNLELCAVKKYKNLLDNYYHAKELHSNFIRHLDKSNIKFIMSELRSPFILTLMIEGVRGETIMHELNDLGIIVGTGSACSSNKKKRYSRTILACGIDERYADGILRISFSNNNTVDEIIKACNIINQVVKRRKEIMQ